MDNAKTKWEQVQSRFKNSWLGIIVLSLIAFAVFLTQIGDSVKKLNEWIRPAPVADLRYQPVFIEPLDKFRDLVTSPGADAIYPGGAKVRFNLTHDGRDDGVININSLDVTVAHEPRFSCPYRLTGDRIYGAGESPLRQFDVFMSGGKIEAVERKEQRNGPVMRGRSNNLLDLDPPLPLVLHKTGDDTESILIIFHQDDPGRYKIGLSLRYTNRNGFKTADVASLAICDSQD
jgi:hypothetical protein